MLHAEMSCNSLRALLGSTVLVASGFATSPASAEDLAQQPYGPAKLPHSGSCVSTTPCVLFIAFESSVDAVPGKAE